MTTRLLADVAVCLPLDSALTYIVPDDLTDKVKPGRRVVVPVKSKLMTGIVWKVYHGEAAAPLKPIHEVAEQEPILTPDLMKLAEWISDYYVAPLGEVVASMSPPQPGFRYLYRIVRDPGDLALAILESEEPEKAAILKALRDGKPASIESLRRKTGLKGLRQHLDDLLKQGYLERQAVLRARRASKAGPQPAEAIPQQRYHLTVHQAAAYESIAAAISDNQFRVFLLHGVTG
ncbi:MAG TPA: hypothetical protein ENI46_03760, partial [Firmicutes bacterium]|nr:hypothetical protein [Bacillota bacterium]